ncbi:tetratricopeptide repeat-containing glycosyltransferase family protein [Thalassobaculum sp.]|uniref:tetratricopeptide repeat-containing glycosyltransferase family protein n=1 Tax=Thalassobaculum sp. TaxID=2022740 RepID=UPI0032EFB7C4
MTEGLDGLDRAARAAIAASDWNAAGDAFEAIAGQVPGNSRPWYSLGLARSRSEDTARAVPALRRCLLLHPTHAGAWGLLGTVSEHQAGYLRGAVLPDASVGTLKIAAALRQEAGDARGAVVLLDRVLAQEPDDIECLINRAMALIEVGRKSVALDDLDRALRLDPSDTRARWSRGWIRLGRRDWSGGDDYAARWLDPEPDSRQRLFSPPLWTGTPVSGGPLLLWGQFGVGDEILFATLVAEARHRANAPVVLEADPRLVGLFGRSLTGVTVVPRMDPADSRIAAAAPTAQSSTARLPGVLPRDAVLAPGAPAMLVADPARVAHWREQFAALGPGPHIGLAWRSGNRRTASRKSIALAALAPVLRASQGTWISLQYDPDPEETAEVAASRRPVPFDNPAADIRDDLDELAAQIAALDAVVTISGTNAHLAGALGVPGLVLMQRDPLWFWFEDGETVPWYPSLTVLRQRGTAWDAVIAEAARRIATL